MINIYDRTQENPITLTISMTDVLRDTVDSLQQSPDSSIDILNSTESMMRGTPASSESIALPEVLPLLPDSIGKQISEELQPPLDPNLLAQYQAIIALPGPLSMKRKALNRLEKSVSNNSAVEITDSDDLRIQQAFSQGVRNRKAMTSQKRKRPSAPPSSSSASSRDIQTSSNEEVRASIPLSPASSQLKTQSPFTTPAVPRRKLIPSKKPTNPVQSPKPSTSSSVTSPNVQPPSPVDSPPLNTGQRRYVSSNSDHSNGAAPRRYQHINPVTNLGASGRDTRAPSIKNLGG